MERDSSITGVVSSDATLINAIKCQVYEFIKSDRLIQARVKNVIAYAKVSLKHLT